MAIIELKLRKSHKEREKKIFKKYSGTKSPDAQLQEALARKEKRGKVKIFAKSTLQNRQGQTCNSQRKLQKIKHKLQWFFPQNHSCREGSRLSHANKSLVGNPAKNRNVSLRMSVSRRTSKRPCGLKRTCLQGIKIPWRMNNKTKDKPRTFTKYKKVPRLTSHY